MDYNDKNTWLNKIKKARVFKNDEIIKKYTQNKNVLDVGCIGQDHNPNNPNWLHQKIKTWAKSTKGVDINTDLIEQMKTKGYDILHTYELENLKEKFEVINISHVIEHVDDITSFLCYYKKFLKENGVIIIGTPNPFNLRQFFTIFLYGKPSVNEEHTTHIDPIVMLELLNRAKLKINNFFWIAELSKPRNKREKIMFPLFKLVSKFRKFYSPNYIIVVE